MIFARLANSVKQKNGENDSPSLDSEQTNDSASESDCAAFHNMLETAGFSLYAKCAARDDPDGPAGSAVSMMPARPPAPTRPSSPHWGRPVSLARRVPDNGT